MEKRIEEVLETVRPYLQADGGDVKFIKYDKGIVYLEFIGHCAGCPMKQMTLNEGIRDMMINQIDEVIDVKLV